MSEAVDAGKLIATFGTYCEVRQRGEWIDVCENNIGRTYALVGGELFETLTQENQQLREAIRAIVAARNECLNRRSLEADSKLFDVIKAAELLGESNG